MAGMNSKYTSSSSCFMKFENVVVPEPSEFPPFMVLELNRYYPEPSCRKLYGIDTCHFWDVFDITLSDGAYKMKFVLTADACLNKMVSPGSWIELKKFARYWDEKSITGEAVVVIQEFEVIHKQPVNNFAEYCKLSWTRAHNSRQTENVPLASARCYYVDNWTRNVATESLECEFQSCKLSSIDMAEVYSIKDIMTKKFSQSTTPALLVKVMRKSRLLHYVTHSKEDKWPLQVVHTQRNFNYSPQLPLMVADRTGWCAVVLWNKLVLQVFNQVHEGSLFFLKNFCLKKSIQQKTKSFFDPPKGTVMFPYELSLNIHHPAAEVKLVTCDSDDDIKSLHFPLLESCFMTRRNLISVPDFSNVDVAGLVTYVGRVEREPIRGSASAQEDSGAFYYRRWVHLSDTSLSDPIIALIYSGDQKDTFLSLKPGHYLLCRHILTNQRLDELISSGQKRHGWLTTTANSRLYVFKPSNTEKLPESLVDIVKTSIPQHPSDYKDLYREGGFFRYPPFSFSLESLQKSNSKVLELIVPSNQWKDKFNRMTWRECNQLAVHASFVSLMLTKVKKINAVRCSPRKKIHLDESADTSVLLGSGNIDTNHLGSTQTEDIFELWPSTPTGNSSKSHSALVIKWQGLGDHVILNTIKPFALNTIGKIDNFSHLVSGLYDSDLGLIDSVRSELTKEEITIVTKSAQSLVDCKFFLLLDVYTNSHNRQLVVLNRAFHI